MSEEKTPRKVMLVIEDDGGEMFKFYLAGDIQRIGLPSIPISHYSAAEFWGAEIYAVIQKRMQEAQSVKKLNRKDRRQHVSKP
jgi:hypothetical protein